MPTHLQPARAWRGTCALLLAFVIVGFPRPASTLGSEIEEAPSGSAIRPLHPLVNRLLELGRERSKTLTAIVDGLARHQNLVIQVDIKLESTSHPHGSLLFVASAGDYRFLRVQLQTGSTSWPTDLRDLTIMLAHELWHATEVANHDVRTVDEFRRLFQSIGKQVNINAFETDEARQVSEAVRLELSGFPSMKGTIKSIGEKRLVRDPLNDGK